MAEQGPGRSSPFHGVLLVLLVFAVFFPAWGFEDGPGRGFIWDDDDHYLNDHLVNQEDGWWRIWFDPHPGVVGSADGAWVWNYWPLTRSSFWLDKRLFTGDDGQPRAPPSRIVNVALHALNALLLMQVLRRLRVPGAEIAALLFAVHPVTVESVAWITERKNLLSTAFFLLSLSAWLRFEREGDARFYVGSAAAFLLALLGKSSTVALPVVLVLLQWYRREPGSRASVLRLAPFFGMALVAGVTSILFEKLFIDPGLPSPAQGIGERIAAAGWIAWFYLGKQLLPVGLSFNYPRFQIDPAAFESYLPTAAALLTAAVAWRFREGWGRPVVLAGGVYGALLFPVLGFFDLFGMRYAHVADHWQYLACLPVLAGVGAGVASLPGRLRALRMPLVVGVLLGFAWTSFQHAKLFVDDDTLFRHALEQQPRSVLASNNLGNRLLSDRRYAEAIPYFERSIESGARIAAPYVNLGIAREAVTGRLSEGVRYYEMALEVEPGQPQALHYLAIERRENGDPDAAEGLLRRALEAHPTYLPGLRMLAGILEAQGRGAELRPFLLRAGDPVRERIAGGRRLMVGVWSALGALMGAVVWIGYSESRAKS